MRHIFAAMAIFIVLLTTVCLADPVVTDPVVTDPGVADPVVADPGVADHMVAAGVEDPVVFAYQKLKQAAQEAILDSRTDADELFAKVRSLRLRIGRRLPELEVYIDKLQSESGGSVGTASTDVENQYDGKTKEMQIKSMILEALRNDLRLSQIELDDKAEKMLKVFGDQSKFTWQSTIAFAILVGIVIIGFFYIAITSDDVKKAIFTSESGIQFVTMFSIIIAIILFGVLKILEGRELAALLGGLSGYILGRGSQEKTGAPPQQPVGGPTQAQVPNTVNAARPTEPPI